MGAPVEVVPLPAFVTPYKTISADNKEDEKDEHDNTKLVIPIKKRSGRPKGNTNLHK